VSSFLLLLLPNEVSVPTDDELNVGVEDKEEDAKHPEPKVHIPEEESMHTPWWDPGPIRNRNNGMEWVVSDDERDDDYEREYPEEVERIPMEWRDNRRIGVDTIRERRSRRVDCFHPCLPMV
jgi:hypothetical protein